MHDQAQAYRVTVDRPGLPAGSIVYRPGFYDWGCAAKDTRRTGRRFVSVTSDPAGAPPSFTVPLDELAEIVAEAASTPMNPAAAALDRWQAFFADARRDDPAFEQLWPIYGVVCDALRFVGEADAPPLVAAWQALDEVTVRLPENSKTRARAEAVMDRIAAITMGQPSARPQEGQRFKPPQETIKEALLLLGFIEVGLKEGDTAEEVLYWCGRVRRELEGKGER